MFFKSLVSRVIILNILLLATGIGVFTFIHLRMDQADHIASARENANLLASTIENSIFNAMCRGESHKLQLTLATIGRSQSLTKVRIFHPSGIILNSANPLEVGDRIDPVAARLFQEHHGNEIVRVGAREVLTVVKPIMADERCFMCHGSSQKVIGVLNLAYSLDGTTQKLRRSSQFFMLSTVLMIILLSAGVSFILLRFVKRPMRNMAEKMAQVKAGDLSVRMVPAYSDEMGSLMESFNAMVVNLEKANTELQEMHYRQMERADRLASVGEMASGLAHEIKNPLAGISSAISVLADDYPADDPRRDIVGKVIEQIGRLNKTVTDLLYFGRPGKPECSYTDINSLVRKTLFFIAQHPEAKQVHRVEEFTRDLPQVWVDEKQIQQVFFNVMINAVQAMEGQGTLRVTTEHAGSEGREKVLVKVSDTGKGIPPDKLETIFVPFFTTKTQGTGLGLPICRRLMEQNGGTILVSSKAGEGTTFTIELPVVVRRLLKREEDDSAQI